jgi:8-oxo-dGTP diphosphatase
MSHESIPILTVDVPLFTLQGGRLCVALQQRDRPPHEGRLALLGGFVWAQEDEDARATALRILRQKAGLADIYIEQLMTFSGRERDPRGWSASIVYYALVPTGRLALGRGLVVLPVEEAQDLPFDHAEIVAKGVERLRNKATYSSLPAFLLPPHFTLPQLKQVYESVMGTRINDSAFRRKIDELRLLEPIEGAFDRESARPAQLYRLRQAGLRQFDRRL